MSKIVCLPMAGPQNPYQSLMMQGLRTAGHQAVHGNGSKIFAFSRSMLAGKADYLHLDWANSYYMRSTRMLTLIQFGIFRLDLFLFGLMGKPLVWTLHNVKEHDTSEPTMDKAAKRKLANMAAVVRVFSKEQAAVVVEYLGIGPEKIVVVPEGSYGGHYPDRMTREACRAALGYDEDNFVILNFGNLRPYKGCDMLIEVFRKKPRPSLRLRIVGRGHTKLFAEKLKLLAYDDKRIVVEDAYVAEERVQVYMKAADLAVFPFRRIDNSGSVILAMGFGLPVLAPRVGAVAERLKGQDQLLFEIEEGEAGIEKSLGKALDMDRAALKAIGEANKRNVERYSWVDFGAIFSKK